jgi:hypothetical protein
MRFVDDEFLLLSRTGRVSPGLNQRLGRVSSRPEAERGLRVRAASRRRRSRWTRRLRASAAGLVGPVSRSH